MRFLREELIAEGFPGGVGIRGRPIQPNLEPMKKQVGHCFELLAHEA